MVSLQQVCNYHAAGNTWKNTVEASVLLFKQDGWHALHVPVVLIGGCRVTLPWCCYNVSGEAASASVVAACMVAG